MKPVEFIATYENDILTATIGTNIFPSVKMAQMALETGWGKSKIGNNMFGIKAVGRHSPYWTGATITAQTQEYISGSPGTYREPFRQYETIADSIKDHNHFLINNPRYRNAGVFAAATPEAQAQALQAAGYATDPRYAEKLISIINANNLKRIDQKKK